MEENKNTDIPEKAKRQMDTYISIQEKERKIKEETHLQNMKNLDYRRWYYQNELKKHMDMIPKEYYYKAEYEDMEALYEKYLKKMDFLEKEEDFEALLKEFRKKTGKKWDSNKVIRFVLVGFFVLFIGLMIYLAVR